MTYNPRNALKRLTIPDDEFHKRIASIKLNPEWFTERISIPSPMREFYLWFKSKDNGKKKRP